MVLVHVHENMQVVVKNGVDFDIDDDGRVFNVYDSDEKVIAMFPTGAIVGLVLIEDETPAEEN